MIYSFEELDKMSLDLLEKYNNNELYYINMDNKNIFMLLQFLYGRCLISEELKVKFSPLYDHLFQTQIYRNYSDEDIAFLVDNLLIDKDTHEVTKFLDVVCSWNNLGKKVLDYMYDKGYYDEMAKITNPLIFMYPNEKESYAKKISGRVIIYDFSDEKYKIKQAVFAIASGFDNFKVANYIKFLLYEKKIDRLYLLYFFRDYLLDEDEKKAFDENLKVIVGIEGIEKIKKM